MSTQVINVDDGYLVKKIISASTNNATVIKNSPGRLMGFYFSNINTAPRYVKFYDKATLPNVGFDTPVMTIGIPGSTAGAGCVTTSKDGVNFFKGISIAITGGIDDNDNTSISVSEVAANFFYK